MNLSDKWTFAKQSRLCYRCLGEGYTGCDSTKSEVAVFMAVRTVYYSGKRNVDEDQSEK